MSVPAIPDRAPHPGPDQGPDLMLTVVAAGPSSLPSEAAYRALVEQIPAITYTAGFGHGRWYYVSPQIEPILGYTAERWSDDVGIWRRCLYPADRDLVLEAEGACREPGKSFHSEYRLLAADGRIVWFRDEARVVEGPGELVRQGVMYDITERKRAEKELERALAGEREASDRLRILDEMKKTFLHAVSHELRTPLAAVLGFALTLEREEVQLPPDERKDLLGRLAANARKLEQLLSDLLDLDRLDRGIVEPRRRPTDLAALVRRVVEGSELLGQRPVRVDADLVVASIDGPKVERIVENLLVNAARHTPAGTAIWARVRRTGGGVHLIVEDEGPGVAEELRESIFEAFRRGPDAPRHSRGVGIGLSLVARFAELHGGRAWVEPRPGGGSRFVVFLPDAPADTASGAGAGAGTPVLAGPQD
jgi:PAS domain S-box-containing protein